MMIAAPLAIVVLLIPLGLLAATVWLWVRVVRGFAVVNTDTPTCGRCGAGVRGIASLTCPECGADLREVGIVTPQGRRPVSLVAFALGWTLLPALPALVLLGLLVAIGPTRTTSTFRVSISDGPDRLVVAGRFVGPMATSGTSTSSSSSVINNRRSATTTLGLPLSPTAVPERMSVQVVTPSGTTDLAFDAGRGAFVASGHAGASQSVPLLPPVDADDVRAVLSKAAAGGPSLDDDQIAGVAALLNGLAAGQSSITIQGWGGGASSSFGGSTSPAGWYLATVITGLALVYVAGYVAYFRLAAARVGTLERDQALSGAWHPSDSPAPTEDR